MAKNIDGQIEVYLSNVHNSDNAKIIRRYLRFVNKQSPKTKELKVYVITKMETCIDKPFMDITRDDLEDYTYGDTFMQGARGKLNDSTIHNYLVNIKSFFKALHCDFDKSKMKRTPYPDCVSWIDTESSKKTKLPSELLEEDEVLSMLNSCDNVRDRLMISLFYDTAGRISEVLNLNEDDIHADSYGLYIIVDGKTGMRRIRLHVSEPYVKEHLKKPTKGKPLLTTANGRISDSQTRRILRKWGKKAEISKNIYPHLFRHTKLTAMAKGMTDAQLRIYAGWTNTSIMTGVYIHLSGADIDNKQLEMYGMKTDDVVEETPLKPVKCPQCNAKNSPLAIFCYSCRGKIGDIPIDTEVDTMNNKIEQVIRENAEMKEEMKKLKTRDQFHSALDILRGKESVDEKTGEKIVFDEDNEIMRILKIYLEEGEEGIRKRDVKLYGEEFVQEIEAEMEEERFDEKMRIKYKKNTPSE